MQISKEMKIWAEKNTICIQVNPYFTYWAKITRIGNVDDTPDMPTMYGWLKHLRDKVWWNLELEKSFIELSELVKKE